MKKIVLLIMVILLALVLPAHAKDAPPELSVFPDNTQWVLHFDVQRFIATDFYGYFKEIKDGPINHFTDKIREKLNIDFLKDVSWITVFGQRLDNENAAFCCKGNFNTAYLISLVEKEITHRNIPYGKHTIHAWGKQFGAFAGSVFVFSKNENMMKNVLDAIDGKNKNLKGVMPMTLTKGMPEGTFLSIVADDLPSIMGNQGNTFILKQTRMAFFMAMEKSGNLNLKLKMTAESAEAARNIEQVVRGLVAMAKLQQGEKTHEGHMGAHALLLKYLDDLMIVLDGNTLRLELSVPSKELAEMLLAKKKSLLIH